MRYSIGSQYDGAAFVGLKSTEKIYTTNRSSMVMRSFGCLLTHSNYFLMLPTRVPIVPPAAFTWNQLVWDSITQLIVQGRYLPVLCNCGALFWAGAAPGDSLKVLPAPASTFAAVSATFPGSAIDCPALARIALAPDYYRLGKVGRLGG